MRDWQPHLPGDPTFTPIAHRLSGTFALRAADLPRAELRGNGALLPLGLFMPDARMGGLATTADAAAAFSIRLANDGVGWVALAGEGAVNVIGAVNATVLTV